MILRMVNNKIKQEMENYQRGYSHAQTEKGLEPQEQSNDMDEMIKEMSLRLPRSECDEFESTHFSHDRNKEFPNDR